MVLHGVVDYKSAVLTAGESVTPHFRDNSFASPGMLHFLSPECRPWRLSVQCPLTPASLLLHPCQFQFLFCLAGDPCSVREADRMARRWRVQPVYVEQKLWSVANSVRAEWWLRREQGVAISWEGVLQISV